MLCSIGDMVYRWTDWPYTKEYCIVREVNSRNVWGCWCYSEAEAIAKAFAPKSTWTFEPRICVYRCRRAEDLDIEPPGGRIPKSFMSFTRKIDKEYNLRV